MKCKETIICIPKCEGKPGPRGQRGLPGTPGIPGTPGGISDAAYIYNLESDETITIPKGGGTTSSIPFSARGTIIGSNITHTAGEADIGIEATGVYEITYYIERNDSGKGQIGLFIDSTIVSESIYGQKTNSQVIYGQLMVDISEGSILTLRNIDTNQALVLTNITSGEAADVNASIIIKKLS